MHPKQQVALKSIEILNDTIIPAKLWKFYADSLTFIYEYCLVLLFVNLAGTPIQSQRLWST